MGAPAFDYDTFAAPAPIITAPGSVFPHAALAADAPQQAVLVVLGDVNSLGVLMASTAFRSMLSTGRLLFATPAVGDAVQLTGDTMVATLSVAAKPSA